MILTVLLVAAFLCSVIAVALALLDKLPKDGDDL